MFNRLSHCHNLFVMDQITIGTRQSERAYHLNIEYHFGASIVNCFLVKSITGTGTVLYQQQGGIASENDVSFLIPSHLLISWLK